MPGKHDSVTSSTYSGHSGSGKMAVYHKDDSVKGKEKSGGGKDQLTRSAEAAQQKRRDNKAEREAREKAKK